jgi:hypothetical protein
MGELSRVMILHGVTYFQVGLRIHPFKESVLMTYSRNDQGVHRTIGVDQYSLIRVEFVDGLTAPEDGQWSD